MRYRIEFLLIVLIVLLPAAPYPVWSQEEIEWGALDEQTVVLGEDSNPIQPDSRHSGFYYAIGAIAAAALAGVLLRYSWFRRLRLLILLTSLIVLGFFNGGCPCMISSMQNFVLWSFGESVRVHSLFWFLALLPLTYFLGRVWCGWICHLGALQEFLHRSPLSKFRSRRSQKILRAMRWILFVLLIVQLAITRNNIFIHYDPFKVVFNLFSANHLGWWLVALLLLSSLFIYQPFCQGACPVGLILSWVSRLPGAYKLSTNCKCTDCGVCARHCPTGAIASNREFDSGECVMCGVCLDCCKKNAIESHR